MKQHRLVIIGATGTAMKRTIPALHQSPKCTVTAIQGRDAAKLAQAKSQWEIPKTYTDVREMLAAEQFDAVFIGTPPFLHKQDIDAAAETGKPIICEKPLASSLADAESIDETLRDRSDVPFMLAHHLRHQPAVRDIRDWIHDGAIGEVRTIWAQWGFELNREARNAAWKLKPNLGGLTAFHDAGVHLIDLLLYLLGTPRAVRASGLSASLPVYDNVVANLEYDRCIAALNCSQTMPLPSNDLAIFGTAGRIYAKDAIGEKCIRSVVLTTKHGDEVREYESVNLYRAEIEAFFDYLDGTGARIGTDIDESMVAMRILDGIATSIREGGRVRL